MEGSGGQTAIRVGEGEATLPRPDDPAWRGDEAVGEEALRDFEAYGPDDGITLPKHPAAPNHPVAPNQSAVPNHTAATDHPAAPTTPQTAPHHPQSTS